MNVIEKYKQLPIQVKASFWFLICGFLTKGVSLITTPIFTRLLSSAEYGQFGVFHSWYGMISVIVSLNLCSGVYSRGLVVYEDKRKEYSSSLQGLCFTLCVIWTVIYLFGRTFWNALFSLNTIQMLAMLAMIWLNSAFQFWALSQRVDFRYQRLVIVTGAAAVMQSALGIFLVLRFEDKVTARILGMLVVELVIYLWLFLVQMFQGKTFFSRIFWKHALLFNLPLVPHYLSMTLLNSADRIMIDRLAGSDKAGIYNLAYSVSQIMIIFNTALIQTFEPWLYKKIKNRDIEEISAVATPSFVLIAGVNILLIAFAPEVISIFAPAEYHEAVWIIPPVAMSVFFMYLYTFFAIFEFYYEKTRYVMTATAAGAMLNILLNYVCIQWFGYYAAGYTTLICYMLFSALHYYYMKKICREQLDRIHPYNESYLLGIIIVFMTAGFFLLVTYGCHVVRYITVFLFIICIFVKRKQLQNLFVSIIKIKRTG